MREGNRSPASARAKSALWSLLAIALTAASNVAWAQAPWGVDETAKPAKAATAASPNAQPATTGATAAPGSAESLPWLGTETTPAAVPGPPAAAAPPTAPIKPAKSDAKKTAALPQKCEEQAEDGCRALKSCAWVAEMPTVDGKLTPARCAERKVFAPEKEKKAKPVAAKPKPEKPAAAVTGSTEPAKSEAKAETPPETNSEPPKQAKVATEPAPVPEPQPAPVQVEAPQPQDSAPAAAATAAAPPSAEKPIMPVRPAVPFLPPPAEAPRSDAPQAMPSAPDKVASDGPGDGAKQPLSMPGLVIE